MQREITKAVDLLDAKGNVLEPGYAKKALLKYDRNAIKAKSITS